MVTTSYEASDDDDELNMVQIVSQNNNNSNVLSDSNSDSDDKDEENFIDENINDKIEPIPNATINAKVVCAMRRCKLCIMTMPTKSLSKLHKKVPSKILVF